MGESAVLHVKLNSGTIGRATTEASASLQGAYNTNAANSKATKDVTINFL